MAWKDLKTGNTYLDQNEKDEYSLSSSMNKDAANLAKNRHSMMEGLCTEMNTRIKEGEVFIYNSSPVFFAKMRNGETEIGICFEPEIFPERPFSKERENLNKFLLVNVDSILSLLGKPIPMADNEDMEDILTPKP